MGQLYRRCKLVAHLCNLCMRGTDRFQQDLKVVIASATLVSTTLDTVKFGANSNK